MGITTQGSPNLTRSKTPDLKNLWGKTRGSFFKPTLDYGPTIGRPTTGIGRWGQGTGRHVEPLSHRWLCGSGSFGLSDRRPLKYLRNINLYLFWTIELTIGGGGGCPGLVEIFHCILNGTVDLVSWLKRPRIDTLGSRPGLVTKNWGKPRIR